MSMFPISLFNRLFLNCALAEGWPFRGAMAEKPASIFWAEFVGMLTLYYLTPLPDSLVPPCSSFFKVLGDSFGNAMEVPNLFITVTKKKTTVAQTEARIWEEM